MLDILLNVFSFHFSEAEKHAQVAKINWNMKIMEKESEQKISEIEGMMFIVHSLCLSLNEEESTLSASKRGLLFRI